MFLPKKKRIQASKLFFYRIWDTATSCRFTVVFCTSSHGQSTTAWMFLLENFCFQCGHFSSKIGLHVGHRQPWSEIEGGRTESISFWAFPWPTLTCFCCHWKSEQCNWGNPFWNGERITVFTEIKRPFVVSTNSSQSTRFSALLHTKLISVKWLPAANLSAEFRVEMKPAAFIAFLCWICSAWCAARIISPPKGRLQPVLLSALTFIFNCCLAPLSRGFIENKPRLSPKSLMQILRITSECQITIVAQLTAKVGWQLYGAVDALGEAVDAKQVKWFVSDL